MYQKHVGRFAAISMLALIGSAGLRAQAQTSGGPTISMNVADGATIHQTAGTVLLNMTACDPAGLHSAFISGGYSSANGMFPAGINSATLHLYFFASYYPVGDYKVRCAALNNKGVQCIRDITLHLVK